MSAPRLGRLAGLSAAVFTPAPATPAGPTVLLGHGAGSDFREALLTGVATGLAARGVTSVTFNFPYRERGSRLPDRGPVLEECFATVADALATDLGLRPDVLIAGGKSMGGRIATQAAARGRLACRALLLLGYPLHPAGKPAALRTRHLASVGRPMLFVSGTRDPLARRELLEATLTPLGPAATLHLVSDGDHSLVTRVRSGRSRADVLAEVVAVIATWMATLR